MKDRDLVRLYWPVELRPAFDALFAIDDAMGDVVSQSTQPALGAIKLAWWRERLEELDQGKVPAEPRLSAATRELLPRGVSGKSLSLLEAGWAALLENPPEIMPFHDRGIRLLELGLQLLDASIDQATLSSAGRVFAIAQSLRRGIFEGPPSDTLLKQSINRNARPLTALIVLAKRDLEHGSPLEPEATPGRALALLRHRLTGRI